MQYRNTGGTPPSTEVRKHQLMQLALALLCAEPFGPNIKPLADRMLTFGVDLERPDHMIAMSVLIDSLKYGLTPSPRALAILGCDAA